MSDIISREKIADGVYFSCITDPRYKVNRISVEFFADLSEKASLYALVPRLLSVSNKNFPTRKALSEKKATLYSAGLDFNIGHIGDTQTMEINAVALDNKYALEDEDITGEITDILLSCIFEPHLENGVFPADILSQEKKALVEAINADFNDKRIYARKKLGEIFYKGEPAAVNSMGTVSGVEAAGPSDVYTAYKELLETAPIEIFAIGCNDFKTVLEKMKNAFKSAKRRNIKRTVTLPSPIKPAPVEITETMPVTQSKLVLGYKTLSEDFPATYLATMIFGGMTTSKLFMNVREKMSLCYYCWAVFGREKRAIVVDSGVEKENVEKAGAAVGEQLAAVAAGDFTEKDIEAAILNISNNLRTINDHPGNLVNWYMTRIYRGKIESPEESLAEYEGVSKDRIVAAAKSITLDTVYILTGNEEEEQNG